MNCWQEKYPGCHLFFSSSRQCIGRTDGWSFAFFKKVPAQLGISLTYGDVQLSSRMCSLVEIQATMSFMCPLQTCVIVHIEMIFKNCFFFVFLLALFFIIITLTVQVNLQPSAPSFALRFIFAIDYRTTEKSTLNLFQ